MKIARLFIVIILILCLTSSLMAESYWSLALNDDSEDDSGDSEVWSWYDPQEAYQEFEDDLMLGYFVAIVPGFFVHGAGNMYAGNGKRGLTLLGLELLSLVGLFFYAMAEFGSSMSNSDVKTEGKVIGGVSFALFFGTWFWDIITVGGAIRDRHPDVVGLKIESKSNENLAREFGENIYVTMSFRF
ncbi:MAG: hypothetical protein GF310_00785 [candidate division Zixibacteria bacterium]|nr:hypothetical protein [candidate division Zixibacteria bacterium]